MQSELGIKSWSVLHSVGSSGLSTSLEELSVVEDAVEDSGGKVVVEVLLEATVVVEVVCVVLIVVVLEEESGFHCPGFSVVATGLEPSELGVLGGLAHSG